VEFVVLVLVAWGGWWLFAKYRRQADQHVEPKSGAPFFRFAIYYCASKLRWAYDGQMPEELAEIFTSEVSERTALDIAVKGHVYEERQTIPRGGSRTYDRAAVTACKAVLDREIALARSRHAVDSWVAREYAKDGNGPLSAEGLAKETDKLMEMSVADPSVKRRVLISVLKFNVLVRFEELHGTTIEQFEEVASSAAT
jgi:hypothetical protein